MKYWLIIQVWFVAANPSPNDPTRAIEYAEYTTLDACEEGKRQADRMYSGTAKRNSPVRSIRHSAECVAQGRVS